MCECGLSVLGMVCRWEGRGGDEESDRLGEGLGQGGGKRARDQLGKGDLRLQRGWSQGARGPEVSRMRTRRRSKARCEDHVMGACSRRQDEEEGIKLAEMLNEGE